MPSPLSLSTTAQPGEPSEPLVPHQQRQQQQQQQQQAQNNMVMWMDVDELDPRIRIPFREITLHKVIGKGTFKTVYRGSWNNTHVAVVAMRRGGLVAEARLLQRLSIHPNLVQLYRWSTDNAGNEYLVMELLQLGSLDAVLRSIGRQLLTQTKMTVVEQVEGQSKGVGRG
ncbi:hypothetical protein Vretimale_10106 [Volvox reticuliferus]|nr:hypothetical protein Vretifemale_638 [Volvox reticuliferus]GIM05664.1 hypothetical protein Vretimale_10106 [Volvox reticuliferus]